MSNEASLYKRVLVALYRFVDFKQPEVKWTLFTSLTLEAFLVLIKLHSNFLLYADDLCVMFQGLIGALVSIIGVAIAGVAIVVTLFSREQVEIIEKVKKGAFEELLNDFKWLALVAALDTAVFVGIVLIIRSPYPLVQVYVFYLISFLLIYNFFYLLFYCYALIGNCIRLYKLKNTLEIISKQTKSIPVSAIEFQIEFLVAKLLKNNREEANLFYSELINLAEESNSDSNSEILAYLKERYSSYLNSN